MIDGNSAAELVHDFAQIQRARAEPFLEAATDELVDDMFEAPALLREFIEERIPPEHRLDDYVALLTATDALGRLLSQRRAVAQAIRETLDGSDAVRERAQEMADEAERCRGSEDFDYE